MPLRTCGSLARPCPLPVPRPPGSRTSRSGRKGQFYLILGLALIILLFAFAPRREAGVTAPAPDLPFVAANLQRELPNALTLGLNESNGIPVLVNFTRFANRVLAERALNFTPLWVESENITADLNVTAGNFLGANETVALNLSGTAVNLMVANNATNSTTFAAPGESFWLSIAFRDQNETFLWQRDKANLYAFINLTRFDDVLQVNVSA